MKSKRFWIISISAVLVIIGCLTVTIAHAQRDYSGFYEQYKTHDPDSLLQMAYKYIHASQPDSAMACYSLVAGMMPDSHSREVAARRATVLNGMGYIWLYEKGDPSNAYSCFLQAREIAEENSISELLGPICLNLGNIAATTNPTEGRQLYSQALSESLATGDHRNANIAYINLINLAIDNRDTTSIQGAIRTYTAVPQAEGTPLNKYASILTAAARRFAEGDCKEAARIFAEAAVSPDTQLTPERFTMQALGSRTESLLSAGDTLTALDVMRELELLSEKSGVNDIRHSTYRRHADVARSYGHTAEAAVYDRKYLQLSDSLYSFRKGRELQNIENQFNLNRMNRRVATLQRTGQLRLRALIILIGVVVIISVFAVITLLQKRKVDRLLANLYEKNSRLIQLDDTLPLPETPDTASDSIQENHNDNILTEQPVADNDSSQRYRSSKLTPEEKEQGAAAILRVMNQSDRIYQLGFSVQTLAELTGLRDKTVSQIINEIWNVNFNTYLNSFRMREAARRLEDPAQNNVTIEVLAESVGFRNRSHFASLFKAATGMSPAEYRRMATKSKAEKGQNQDL